MADFEAAWKALREFTNYETMVRPPYNRRAMNLPRTRLLLEKLDRPDRDLACLQVAGTKGKGTAATALFAALSAGGYRAGLFTSPHLFDVRERIRTGEGWISGEAFARGVLAVMPHVEPLAGRPECPTFFEILFVLALHHFRAAGVEAAVLEVGLGGRLDATSAVRSLVSVVTHVGLDHTAILGRTRSLIAAEKAGVAKEGVPLLTGVPPSDPAGRVIARAASRSGARLVSVGRDFLLRTGRPRFDGGRSRTPLFLKTDRGETLRARPAVLGRELARDAGLAAAALLLPEVRERLPVDGGRIAVAFEKLEVPGRIQVVAGEPLLVVDGAHNPDSARALARAVAEALPHRRMAAVLGGGVDKGVERTAGILRRRFPGLGLVFTRPASHPRAADPGALAEAFGDAAWKPSLDEALDAARSMTGAGDLVVVTGSLYLAGEALALLGLTP